MNRALGIALCLLILGPLYGQNGPGLKLSGTLGAELQTYRYGSVGSVRESVAFRLYGSPTIRTENWTIPAYFNIGDYQKSYRQAFNKIGISPQYKDWLTLHLGHRTVKFSDLTLDGHNFLGGGVEIQAGKFRLAGVGGQFLKPVVPDTSIGLMEYVMPAYRRTGYAARIGYGTQRHFIDLIYFSAADNVGSVEGGSDTLGLAPATNTVIGLNLRQKIGQRWTLELETALSAYTEDTESAEQDRDGVYPSLMSLFVTGRTTTRYLSAVQSEVTYRVKNQKLSLSYDRIAPGYETMGEYFFRDDIERVKLAASLQFAKNKLRIMPSLGIQRSGIGQVAAIAQLRVIGGLRAYYRPSQKLTLFGNYHNYQTRLKQRAYVPTDTILFTQVNRQLQANANYRFSNQQMISGGISITGGSTKNADSTTSTLAQQMIYANYRHPIKSIDLQLTGGLTFSRYQLPGFNTVRFQPYIILRKAFFKDKLDVSYNTGISLNYLNGSQASFAWRDYINLALTTFKNHQLTIRFAVQNTNPTGPAHALTELQGNVGYRIRL